MSFDEMFLRALAAKGIVPDAKGKWVADPKFKGTPPKAEDLWFMNESAARGQDETNAELRLQWVVNLEHVTAELVTNGTNAAWPFFSVFWIRLHGVFTDLAAPNERRFEILGLDRHTYKANGGSLLHIAQFTLGAIDMIRQRLTEDELLYLDYKRHSESHPIQSAYDLQIQKGGKIIDTRRVPTLGNKPFTIAQCDAAIRRVLKAHRDEEETAVGFAKKVEPTLSTLIAAMKISATRSRR